MVLSFGGSSTATGSANKFEGVADIRRFIFSFKNVLAHDLINDEKARELVPYMDGAVFDYYYDIIVSEVSPILDASNYDHVKQTLLKNWKKWAASRCEPCSSQLFVGLI